MRVGFRVHLVAQVPYVMFQDIGQPKITWMHNRGDPRYRNTVSGNMNDCSGYSRRMVLGYCLSYIADTSRLLWGDVTKHIGHTTPRARAAEVPELRCCWINLRQYIRLLALFLWHDVTEHEYLLPSFPFVFSKHVYFVIYCPHIPHGLLFRVRRNKERAWLGHVHLRGAVGRVGTRA